MKRDETKILMPRLRFPEFRDKGEWEEKALGSICSNISSGKDKNETEGEYDLYGSTGIIGKTCFATYNGNFILVARVGANAGFLNKVYGKFGVTDNALVIFLKDADNIDFIFYTLDKYGLNNLVFGSGQPLITGGQLKSIDICIPHVKEQQKIASCLSSLDDLITAQSQKLETLKAHKKGLMQQLFPAEGETVPKLRFPEFNGEWDRIELGRFIEIKGRIGYRGYTVNDIVKEGEGAISLSPSNINDAGNLSFEKSTYISWEKYEESPEIMLEDGFTILVKTGSSYGKSALVRNLPVKTTINPQLVVLKPVRINGFFLFLIISNSLVQKQINETVVGGAIPTLSQESISKFEVLIPNEIEQQKIASCLSSLDDLIAAQGQKLETLKLHKKGLMQGLFPNNKSLM